jgi:polar amino acid transport system substrate-binding protein
VEFLREHHNMVETASGVESLRMLAAGRADYAVVDLSSGMEKVTAMRLFGRIEPLLSRSVMEQSVYFCFTKGRVSSSFVDAFSDALKQFKQTEAFQAIYRIPERLNSSSKREKARAKSTNYSAASGNATGAGRRAGLA